MNYKLLLLTVFTSCFISLKAQDIKFCFQTGYGFYNMSSLKRNTRYLPFDTKTVSNYPAYQYYKPMIKLVTRNFEFGVVYLFQTTGSRISSKDYSGEYRYDTKINSNSPGVIINKTFHNWGNIKAGLYLQAGANFSVLKLNEYLQVDTLVNNVDYKLKSKSLYFEPGIQLIYPKDNWGIEFNVGYYKEFLRQDYSGENNSLSFADLDMWDGLRIGLTFSYTLMKKEKSSKD